MPTPTDPALAGILDRLKGAILSLISNQSRAQLQVTPVKAPALNGRPSHSLASPASRELKTLHAEIIKEVRANNSRIVKCCYNQYFQLFYSDVA